MTVDREHNAQIPRIVVARLEERSGVRWIQVLSWKAFWILMLRIIVHIRSAASISTACCLGDINHVLWNSTGTCRNGFGFPGPISSSPDASHSAKWSTPRTRKRVIYLNQLRYPPTPNSAELKLICGVGWALANCGSDAWQFQHWQLLLNTALGAGNVDGNSREAAGAGVPRELGWHRGAITTWSVSTAADYLALQHLQTQSHWSIRCGNRNWLTG